MGVLSVVDATGEVVECGSAVASNRHYQILPESLPESLPEKITGKVAGSGSV